MALQSPTVTVSFQIHNVRFKPQDRT